MSSNSEYSGFYVDIWSLGVLLYVMLQGTVPFRATTMEGLFKAQMRMNLTFPVEISERKCNKFTISSTIILHTETVYMTLKKCHFVTQ